MDFPCHWASSRTRHRRPWVQPAVERLEQRRLLSAAVDASASAGTLATADLNGDGRPDLVELGPGSVVSVQLNTGRPKTVGGSNFAPPVRYGLDGTPSTIAVGDFTANGKLDLAIVLTSGPGGIDVLLGNGDGTFQPARRVDIATSPYYNALAIAEVTGDGHPDLVLASGYGASSSVVIIPGDGDGTFGKVEAPYTVCPGDSVAVGDFNGDRLPDLVVSQGGAEPDTSGTVSVWINQGSGKFAQSYSAAAGQTFGMRIVVGDFTGGGKDDFALCTSNLSDGPWTFLNYNSIAVFLGNGDGTFRQQISANVGTYASQLILTDLNGDGKPDLMVSDSTGTDVLRGQGDGTFVPLVDYKTSLFQFGPPAVTGLAAADFNGDGRIDVAEALPRPTGTAGQTLSFVVLEGKGDGTLAAIPATPIQVTAFAPSSLAQGDFNGDGRSDFVVVARTVVNGAVTGALAIELAQADGSYGPPRLLPVDLAYNASVAVGDFNGDGKRDIAVNNDGTLDVLLGRGNGTFEAPIVRPLSAVAWGGVQFNVADLNDDGKSDLVLFNEWHDKLLVLQTDSQGTLQYAQTFAVPLRGAGYNVEVLPINAEGRDDIALTPRNQSSVILIESDPENGTLRAQTITLAAGDVPVGFLTGDVSHDGLFDIVILDDVRGTIPVLISRSDGSFGTPTYYHVRDAEPLAIGDLNGDGNPDIVLGVGLGSISVLHGRGNGTFDPATSIPAAGYTVPDHYLYGGMEAAVLDVPGQSRPDLLTFGYAYPLTIHIDYGDGTFPVSITPPGNFGTPYVQATNSGAPGAPSLLVDGSIGLTPSDLNPGTFNDVAVSAYSQVTFSGTLARFWPSQFLSTPSILTKPSPSGYSAVIDWGDGTTLAGTIVASGPAGWFSVTGSHRYSKAGSFQVRVYLDPVSLLQGQVTIVDQVTVTNAPIAAAGRTVSATEGLAFSDAALAQFTDPGHGSRRTAPVTIDWGDGTTTSGTIQPVAPGQNIFTVYGSHTYAVPGTSTIKVTFVDDLGRTATAIATAEINALPFVVTGTWTSPPSSGEGAAQSDHPLFRGTSDPGSTVRLYAQNARTRRSIPLGTTLADAQGQWALTGPVLPAGSYRVIAKAIDRPGLFTARAVLRSATGSNALVITTAPSVLTSGSP